MIANATEYAKAEEELRDLEARLHQLQATHPVGAQGLHQGGHPHCDNLWHFDTECIDDDDSYVRIAKRMKEMADGSLPLADLEGRVDLEEGKAWLRFTCNGRPVHIDCNVEDDWVDATIFRHFVNLLAKTDPSKIFLYYDLGGQDCIIGCVSREQFKKLKQVLPKVESLT